LLLAGYSTTLLEVNVWAVGVWIVGVVFFGFSVRSRRRSMLWLALALLTMIVGSVFVFRSPAGGSAVSPALAVVTSLFVGGFGWLIARKILEAEARPPLQSLDRLIGQVGEARTDVHHEGSVWVAGELWTARSAQPIAAGSEVRVVGREGLILLVEEVTHT